MDAKRAEARKSLQVTSDEGWYLGERDDEAGMDIYVSKYCMRRFRLSERPVTRLIHFSIRVAEDSGVTEQDVRVDLRDFAATTNFNVEYGGARTRMKVAFVLAGPCSNILMTRDGFGDAILVPYVQSLFRHFSDRWTGVAKVSYLLTVPVLDCNALIE